MGVKKVKSVGAFAAILLCLCFVTACGIDKEKGSDVNHKDDRLKIYTTIYAWEEFSRIIGGEEVIVKNLIPAGSDAHTFEPSARTMIDIAEGEILFYNGAGMEGFVNSVQSSLKAEDVQLVNVTEDINLNDNTTHEHHNHDEEGHAHENKDPHVWLDPVLSIEGAKKIKNTLIEHRPEKEQLFEENYEQLKTKLNDLHQRFKDVTSSAELNYFLVSHEGYGYWETRYDIKQIGVAGMSAAAEPSQKQMQQMVALAEKHGIQHVLIEKNISSKAASVLQDEIGGEVLYLHNLESRTEEEVEKEEDYFSLMYQNIDSLKLALKAKN